MASKLLLCSYVTDIKETFRRGRVPHSMCKNVHTMCSPGRRTRNHLSSSSFFEVVSGLSSLASSQANLGCGSPRTWWCPQWVGDHTGGEEPHGPQGQGASIKIVLFIVILSFFSFAFAGGRGEGSSKESYYIRNLQTPNLESLWSKYTLNFCTCYEEPLKVPWKFLFDMCCLGGDRGCIDLEAETGFSLILSPASLCKTTYGACARVHDKC